MIAGTLWAIIDLTGPIFFALRVVAGIGAASVGWFLTGPSVRILVRVGFRRGVPGWLMPFFRAGGAVGLGLLVFYFLPLGGGPGWGWGLGGGGGPGLGAGDVSGQDNRDAITNAKTRDSKAKGPPGKLVREPVEIELLGGERYQGQDKFYLLKRQAPAVSLEQVEAYFKEKPDRLEVRIIMDPDGSVGFRHPAYISLDALARKYKIPTLALGDEPQPSKK